MMGASGAVRWESCNLTSKFYAGAKRIEVYVQKNGTYRGAENMQE